MATERQTHDVGGLPSEEPLDLQESDLSLFASRVATMVSVLRSSRHRVFVTDELRRAIESLPDYHELAYYERWIQAVRRLLVEKAVLTDEEIDARVEAVRQRLAAERQG